MGTTKLKKEIPISAKLIAPCGMNCRLCRAYIRKRNPCPGCRVDDDLKPATRLRCRIRNCKKMAEADVKYCICCERLPCKDLKILDKRYRTKYGMSMIENLGHIGRLGIRHFIKHEKESWRCPECGHMLCVHERHCLYCRYQRPYGCPPAPRSSLRWP